MDSISHFAVGKLDISRWHTSSVKDAFRRALPAIKSSAAFLTFLRANLVLDPSCLSHTTTPPAPKPTSTQQQHVQPSPKSIRAARAAKAARKLAKPANDTPPLSIDILRESDDKAQAVSLIADSIAQQQEKAALSIVLHPISLVCIGIALALVHWQTSTPEYDLSLLLYTLIIAGFLCTYLAVIYHFTIPYSRLSSSFSMAFLRREGLRDPIRPGSSHSTSNNTSNCSHDEDIVLGVRSGSEVVATLVLRLEPKIPFSASGLTPSGPPVGGRKRSKGSSGNLGPLKGGTGVIRAWTTSKKWRGRGAGLSLLREAVRVTRDRCGRDAGIGFAKEHANSKLVLPDMFNGKFRQQERRAAMALERVMAARDNGRRRK